MYFHYVAIALPLKGISHSFKSNLNFLYLRLLCANLFEIGLVVLQKNFKSRKCISTFLLIKLGKGNSSSFLGLGQVGVGGLHIINISAATH